MKKMICIGFPMALMMVSSAAFAAPRGGVLHEIRCAENPEMRDGGLIVSVDNYFQNGVSKHVATVEEDNIAGAQLLVQFKNVKRIAGTRPGAPLVYSARNFELEVHTTVTPRDGHMPAHVVVDRREGRISEDLLCNFVR